MKITGHSAESIFDSIREGIGDGRLTAGSVLPPVRELAERLGVNRNTVAAAYKRLDAAGLASTGGRRGTTVRGVPAPVAREGSPPGLALHDLAGGNPDPRLLPSLRLAPAPPRLYGVGTVDPRMQRLARASLDADCPQGYALELSHGAVDGIERLLAAWLLPGDRIAVEDPCFLGSLNVLNAAGHTPLPVAVDTHGMQVASLRRALEAGARAVLLTPRAHNPTGASLDAKRARALRQLLAGYPQVAVLIDDHYALLSQQAYHSVLPVDGRRWALLRSLSKPLGPDLRLAWLACDEETAVRLRLRLAAGTGWVSHLLQDAAVSVLESAPQRAKIASAGVRYQQRLQSLQMLLQARGVQQAVPMEGLNLWLPLPDDSRPQVLALAARGWHVRAGEVFAVSAPGHGLRITCAALGTPQQRQLADDLAAVLG
ncbi:transcriptional regulator PtsJ [Stenotrophomonas sp. TWI143]|jgi:DNA-binding transcriptional MocR family regulator|uniref:MocR-like B6 salvage transcription factor PtsJ n=1 Tax=Stenotrophomonas sp. TWI143 TaxID=3136771 RepID=UPI001EB1AA0D|nr:transcriptional regulator PtsJ [Stenotrophomonas maltophilia]HDS1220438.1 transcriptional regulator PtsJ [Stenotrophomonas maltophilia]HDS1233315.1 transcriptional regulator PtsJ [Stenotrophomonas maltophilia]HEL4259298.1 transcriptional regulator PtsJ [Stenotrophomonas maltophilia]